VGPSDNCSYWGNYSFFGAPFIWTTLHNMGGNDGLKGDMRMLEGMPSDAIAAGSSIVGTGATPEGINQNPAYYEHVKRCF
jgi:alpha-N-acetylglucosaminidase